MKKIFFLLLIFTIGLCKNALSDPIKIYGVDASMDIATIEAVLKTKGFQCSAIGSNKICFSSKKYININADEIIFNCETFGGCSYKASEIRKALMKEFNMKIDSREIITNLMGSYQAICGEGSAGDKLCIVNKSLTSDIGPDVYLLKHKLGSTGLTFN